MAAPAEAAAGAAGRAFYAWAVAFGVLAFGSAWAWQGGWWGRMMDSDPSGISAGIVALTGAVTLWCGLRTRRLGRECGPGSPWRNAYRDTHARGAEQAAQRLGDLTHGPHETAWWFAGTTIKLGLLGTVVGFIVMIGQIDLQGTDTAQIQALLAQMTKGMGIALVTTLVGLVANLLLGIQLLLLDRLADRVAGAILDAEAIHP
ncbi:MAG TPA: MotA/TolQ/ExbB proton channel family protein [Methylibium sp.]|nr:MotA/TolQ/ExbB proton channel family protein [Methylibium sp.]